MGTDQLYQLGIKWIRIASASTFITRSGQAKLHRVIVNNGVAGTATIYNNSAGSGDVVATVDTTNPIVLDYNGIILDTGLTVVTNAGADLTIVYE